MHTYSYTQKNHNKVAYMQKQKHRGICTHIHTYTYTQKNNNIVAYVHIYIQIHIHKTKKHSGVCTHIHTNTYTQKNKKIESAYKAAAKGDLHKEL